MKTLFIILMLSLSISAQDDVAKTVAATLNTLHGEWKPRVEVYNAPVGEIEVVRVNLVMGCRDKRAQAEANRVRDAIVTPLADSTQKLMVTVRAVCKYDKPIGYGDTTYSVSPIRITTFQTGNVFTAYITGGNVTEYQHIYTKRTEGEIAVAGWNNVAK